MKKIESQNKEMKTKKMKERKDEQKLRKMKINKKAIFNCSLYIYSGFRAPILQTFRKGRRSAIEPKQLKSPIQM